MSLEWIGPIIEEPLGNTGNAYRDTQTGHVVEVRDWSGAPDQFGIVARGGSTTIVNSSGVILEQKNVAEYGGHVVESLVAQPVSDRAKS